MYKKSRNGLERFHLSSLAQPRREFEIQEACSELGRKCFQQDGVFGRQTLLTDPVVVQCHDAHQFSTRVKTDRITYLGSLEKIRPGMHDLFWPIKSFLVQI